MLKNLTARKITYETEYLLTFIYKGQRGSGYSFPCDAEGVPLTDGLTDLGLANLERCRTGSIDGKDLQDPYVRSYEHKSVTPATGTCACGRRVYLEDSWVNPCECGREYNLSGGLLAPRSQWGTEYVTQPEEDYGLYSMTYNDEY